MPKFYYSPKAEKEMSPFIRFTNLKFTLNYLKLSCNPNRSAIINNLLCMMPEKNAKKIVASALKAANAGQNRRQPARDVEDEEFPFLNDEFEMVQTSGIEQYDECVDFLSKHWEDAKMEKISREIIGVANAEKDKLAGKKDGDDFFRARIAQMGSFLQLGDADLDVFLVIYFASKNTDFESMCDNSRIDISSHRTDTRNRILNIRKFTGLDETAIRKVLSNEGPLMKYGILDKDFDIGRHVVEYIEGLSNEPLSSQFFKKFSGEAVPIEYHLTMKKHIDTIARLIRNREAGECVNILLYGLAGTGKTEFCRSLGRHLGMDLYDINKIENDDRPASGPRFRFSALRVCQNAVNLDKSVIVIDEADEMLNGSAGAQLFSLLKISSRNTDKELINEFLDSGVGVYFWITNHFIGMEESTRRRFDYSIEFKKFTLAQRRQLWQTCIAKHRLGDHFSSDEMALLAKKYEINAGGIDLALRNYRRMTKDSSEIPATEPKLEILGTILLPHMSLTGGKASSGTNDPVAEYSLDGLNIKGSQPISKTIEIMRSFSMELDENPSKSRARNMNLLLYGPPGTGKTEFAKFAAAELARPLISKKGSDLLSMWVGGTEQLIRDAFREAESEGGILFIDEADGLLAERSGAQRNWQVTQVNEFLADMEEFRGILICATNFKKNMDSASIRRFNLKIEFDYLDSDGKAIFFDRILKPLAEKPLSDAEKNELAKIDLLTPGDFKVVRQKNIFLPKEEISNRMLIDALRDEVAAKNGVKTTKIGF